MSTSSAKSEKNGRPDFMVALGLAPPYSPVDVKQAYLTKAKETHPDRGGSAEAFHRLHEAFEQATQYVQFRGDRRGWIASNMESYVALQEALTRLMKLGAEAETDAKDWLKKSFGDFAQLTEQVTTVRLENSPHGDKLIGTMLEELPSLREVRELVLAGSQVTDEAVLRLEYFSQLRRLDLSRTPVTKKALAVTEKLPLLISLELDGSRAGWLARRKAQSILRGRRKQILPELAGTF